MILSDQHVGRVLVGDVPGDHVETVDGAGGGAGLLAEPGGLVQLSDGSVIVADTGNHRLALWDAITGWTTSGGPGTGVNEYRRPTAVAIDGQGRILVADTGNHRVVRMNAIDGTGWTAYGQVGMPTASDPAVGRFAEPRGIAVDGAGHILVADPRAGRLVRLDDLVDTGWVQFAFPPLAAKPMPMAVCALDTFMFGVSDVANRVVWLFELDGTVVARLDGAALGLPLPTWLAPRDLDGLFVGDPVANDVRGFFVQNGAFVAAGRLRGGGAQWPMPRFDQLGGIASGGS